MAVLRQMADGGTRSTAAGLISRVDPVVWKHIEVTSKVDPHFFAFRWITLLLSQEFDLPDTLRLWDAILADPHGRADALLRVCCAMVVHVRGTLLQGDFSIIVKTLQRYPLVDVDVLLALAASYPPCSEVLAKGRAHD
ncbi:hypothetical protein FOA52_011617 [Chlamydomonas sp. UWO 241]|nr:hypothetical protein FOA52_011617 [Chlamydomonas sp. UWO 241]